MKRLDAHVSVAVSVRKCGDRKYLASFMPTLPVEAVYEIRTSNLMIGVIVTCVEDQKEEQVTSRGDPCLGCGCDEAPSSLRGFRGERESQEGSTADPNPRVGLVPDSVPDTSSIVSR